MTVTGASRAPGEIDSRLGPSPRARPQPPPAGVIAWADRGTRPSRRREGADQMTLLESISGPRDLKALGPDELPALASEIRDLLIETVSRTSGHLGPNLGVVELTIALHRV